MSSRMGVASLALVFVASFGGLGAAGFGFALGLAAVQFALAGTAVVQGGRALWSAARQSSVLARVWLKALGGGAAGLIGLVLLMSGLAARLQAGLK